MRYDDFDLHFLRDGDDYLVQVLASPAGAAEPVDFSVPFAPLELADFLARIGVPRSGLTGAEADELAVTIRMFGGRLFDAVFVDEIGDCLTRSRTTDAGLRIRLHLDDCPELADLPWELLYHTVRAEFLCLSEETPLVRYRPAPDPAEPLTVSGPLRILAVVGQPDSGAQWAALAAGLATAIDRGQVVLDRLDAATPADLHRALAAPGGADGHHVLVVLDESMLDDGSRLADLLADHPSLRLVVLHDGAEGVAPVTGVARTLIDHGVPAVVAMQFEISDPAAIAFAETFYPAVAANRSLDEAVADARTGILAQPNRVEWATPVLYTRVPDTHIIRLEAATPPPPSSPPPSPIPPARSPSTMTSDRPNRPPTTAPTGRRRTGRRVLTATVVAALVAATVIVWASRPAGHPVAAHPTDPTPSSTGSPAATVAPAPGLAPVVPVAPMPTHLTGTVVASITASSTKYGHNLMFSPDQRLLLASGSGGARIWNVSSPTHPTVAATIDAGTDCIAVFSPTQPVLAVATALDVELWNITDPTHPTRYSTFVPEDSPPTSLGTAARVDDIAFDPSGRQLATDRDGTVHIWSLATVPASRTQTFTATEKDPKSRIDIGYDHNGALLTSIDLAGNTAKVWTMDPTGQPTLATSVHIGTGLAWSSLSPDGQYLISNDSTGKVAIWQLSAPNTPVSTVPNTFNAPQPDVVFSPDGGTVVTETNRGSAAVYDVSTITNPVLIRTLDTPGRSFEHEAFSPDGQLFAVASGSTICIWR